MTEIDRLGINWYYLRGLIAGDWCEAPGVGCQ